MNTGLGNHLVFLYLNTSKDIVFYISLIPELHATKWSCAKLVCVTMQINEAYLDWSLHDGFLAISSLQSIAANRHLFHSYITLDGFSQEATPCWPELFLCVSVDLLVVLPD